MSAPYASLGVEYATRLILLEEPLALPPQPAPMRAAASRARSGRTRFIVGKEAFLDRNGRDWGERKVAEGAQATQEADADAEPERPTGHLASCLVPPLPAQVRTVLSYGSI